jgi:crossover junction endodeoxyribonuclease RusA
MITFSVNGKPIQQGSMKVINGHVLHAKGSELIYWRSAIALEASRHISKMYEGAIRLEIGFRMEKPKSVKRTYPTKPPDLDKLVRSVLDALSGVAYVDDGQVTEIAANKAYGVAGVDITVIPLEEIF